MTQRTIWIELYKTNSKSDKFSIELKGKTYSDKAEAGEAFMKAIKSSLIENSLVVGHYKGFEIKGKYNYDLNKFQYMLYGKMLHYGDLGDDPIGNMTRIENTLNVMDEARTRIENSLNDLKTQLDITQKELEKPFEQEEELNMAQKRLNELNIELAISEKGDLVTEMDDADEAHPSTEEKSKSLSSLLKDANDRVHNQERAEEKNNSIGNDYP